MLKTQLALRQHLCASLEHQFDTATLTAEQWAIVLHRWDSTVRESYALQLMLDLMDRQIKEERGNAGFPCA
jgi:hypothetical protein